jgi:hypothetical protein
MRRFLRSIPVGVALFVGLAAAQADPPARVGRLSLVEGEVTVEDRRTGDLEAAALNWPVTSGVAITTARGARAEVRIGSTAVRLDGATDLEFVQLDDEASLLRLREGTVNVRVRDRETVREFTLETPQSRTVLLETGRYRFDANSDVGTTTVTTFQGNAQLAFDNTAVSVSSGKRAEIGPQGGVEVVGAFADGFDDWALARDRGDDVARSTRYVSPEMTGAESLDEYGDWRATTDYGPVWYPRAVPVGWAPYRTGRWAWIEPWGWTWIDAAPWGFAPFHYGRWALIGGVWAWVPGVFVPRPVFAPALVGWIGAPRFSVSVAIGAVPAVGWFPLAPREVFVPAYRCSTVYVRNVNVTHVTNVTTITNVVHSPRRHFAHRDVERAVTVVPAAAVTNGRPVAGSLVRARHADLPAAASNTPPETVARPPQRSIEDRRARDDRRWSRRAQEAGRPAPIAPAANAGTPPQGDRPVVERSRGEERVRRSDSQSGRPEARAIERPVEQRPPVAVQTPVERPAGAAPPSPNVARPPLTRGIERPVDQRRTVPAAPIERPLAAPPPSPNVASPPLTRGIERPVDQRRTVPAAPVERPLATAPSSPNVASPPLTRGIERPIEQRPPVMVRPAERTAPTAPPSARVPPLPRAVERPAEQRPPVAARPDVTPRGDRARGNEHRAGEPPRRLERDPEPARLERPAERARVPAPPPQAATRPPAPELRREAPPPAPAVRAAPPPLSLPPPAQGRGDRAGDRGRTEAREHR